MQYVDTKCMITKNITFISLDSYARMKNYLWHPIVSPDSSSKLSRVSVKQHSITEKMCVFLLWCALYVMLTSYPKASERLTLSVLYRYDVTNTYTSSELAGCAFNNDWLRERTCVSEIKIHFHNFPRWTVFIQSDL